MTGSPDVTGRVSKERFAHPVLSDICVSFLYNWNIDKHFLRLNNHLLSKNLFTASCPAGYKYLMINLILV